MTNETPDNTPAEPADLTPGQHDLGATLSSEPAAIAEPMQAPESVAPVAPESAVPPASEPVASAAPEPVAQPEPAVPPASESVAAPASEPVAAPVEASATPGYDANPYPAAPAYPGAAAYDPRAGAAPAQQGAHDFAMGAHAGAGPQQTGAYPVANHAGAYPTSAYGMPAAPAPKKPMSKGLLFGLIGGGVVLVLIIAAAIIVPLLLRAPAQTASGVVEGYLTALSEGDAETALTYVETYADESLLTDEVLAASLELAPITDIVVEESEDIGDYGSTLVSASFAIGGETVEREFEVYRYDDDWQLYDGLVTATVSSFEGLGLTVNGVEPGDESVSLFPGTYQLALAYEEFAIDADSDIFTIATDDDSEQFWDLQPVLTEDGAAAFRSLVRAAVEECVAMKTLSTPCGMDISDIDLQGYTPVEDSVTRTITTEGQKDLDEMEPDISYSSPTLVSTYDSVDVDITLQGKKDGTTAEFDVWFGGYMNSPSVDFSAETPTVTWD